MVGGWCVAGGLARRLPTGYAGDTCREADTLPRVYRLLTDMGYFSPLIVTPEEFSGNV